MSEQMLHEDQYGHRAPRVNGMCPVGTLSRLICNRFPSCTMSTDANGLMPRPWLAIHPQIPGVAHEWRWYGEPAAKALPYAVQVADRWHLMENTSRAFLDAVRKLMRKIRQLIGSAAINLHLLLCAERLYHESYLHREETIPMVMALSVEGGPIKKIVRQTGLNRGTIRRILRSHPSAEHPGYPAAAGRPQGLGVGFARAITPVRRRTLASEVIGASFR